MKKFIFLIMLSLGFLVNQTMAQRSVALPLAAGDTITNTGTASKVFGPFYAGYAGIAVQVNLTKLSGTGAGTVALYGSLDGTNYVQIGSSFTITNVASQSTTFYVVSPMAAYFKVLATGSGTESVVQSVYYKLSTTAVTNF